MCCSRIHPTSSNNLGVQAEKSGLQVQVMQPSMQGCGMLLQIVGIYAIENGKGQRGFIVAGLEAPQRSCKGPSACPSRGHLPKALITIPRIQTAQLPHIVVPWALGASALSQLQGKLNLFGADDMWLARACVSYSQHSGYSTRPI